MTDKIIQINEMLPPVFQMALEGDDLVLYRYVSKKDIAGASIPVKKRERTITKANDAFLDGMLEVTNIYDTFINMVQGK